MPGVVVDDDDDDDGAGSDDVCVGVMRRCPDEAVWRYLTAAGARVMRG